jgi:hypothetical protein
VGSGARRWHGVDPFPCLNGHEVEPASRAEQQLHAGGQVIGLVGLLEDLRGQRAALGDEQGLRLGGQRSARTSQPLPFEALVRLEGWAKWLGDLVVNPDTRGALDARLAAGLPAYTNAGFGHAYGIDGMLVGRTRHFSYTLGLGVLSSVRTNPLAVGVQTYPVQWEQRFTGSAGLSWSPNSRWVFTTRANFRTGRPYTPVLGFSADFANERWVPVLGATSSQSYPFLFELNLRGEHRFTVGPLAFAFYVELLT